MFLSRAQTKFSPLSSPFLIQKKTPALLQIISLLYSKCLKIGHKSPYSNLHSVKCFEGFLNIFFTHSWVEVDFFHHSTHMVGRDSDIF